MTEQQVYRLLSRGWFLLKEPGFPASLNPPVTDPRSTHCAMWNEVTYKNEPLIYPHWALEGEAK